MREILFRGKRVDKGEWVEGNLFVDDKGEKCEILVGYVNYRIAWEVIPESVSQFTGLTDKNGTKIFEGDIVVHEDYPNYRYGKQKYIVEYDEGRCGFYPYACGDGCGCCEDETEHPKRTIVIGNIHDNPELLEV